MIGRIPHLAAVALAVLFAVAGCGSSATPTPPTPAPIPAAIPTPSVAVATTLVQVNAALQPQGLTALAAIAAVRPAAPPSFGGNPAWPFTVALKTGTSVLFVIYEFADANVAAAAGADMASYLAGGPGRVQYTSDTQFTLRQVGPPLIFYTYGFDTSADRVGAATVAAAIALVGTEIPIKKT